MLEINKLAQQALAQHDSEMLFGDILEVFSPELSSKAIVASAQTDHIYIHLHMYRQELSLYSFVCNQVTAIEVKYKHVAESSQASTVFEEAPSNSPQTKRDKDTVGIETPSNVSTFFTRSSICAWLSWTI